MIKSDDKIRYSRQISIPEIGKAGQERLLRSRVFIVGCGALGSMIAMQLAGAGVGTLTIADFDTIDISNLQRQFFFATEETGREKVEVLRDRIIGLNPDIRITAVKEMVTRRLAEKITEGIDIIVDGTDNPASKVMIEEISDSKGIACCLGGVGQFRGQVMMIPPGGTHFSEIFSEGSEQGFTPCSIGGVVGPAAGMCASLQSAEVMKYLLGLSDNQGSTLITFNILNNEFKSYSI